MTGATFRLAVRDAAVTDDHVLAILDSHAERNGRSPGRVDRPYGDEEFWS